MGKKRKQYTEEQINGILKKVETGMPGQVTGGLALGGTAFSWEGLVCQVSC